jgi:hypothetical protein
MGVPFVLATALTNKEISQNSVLQGTTNLGKPTNPKALLSAIGVLLSEV